MSRGRSITTNGMRCCVVLLSQITFGADYQRPISKGRAKKIRDNFNWWYFGVVTLVQRGRNRYECPDGQHRLQALRLMYPDGVDEHGNEIELFAIVVPTDEAYKLFTGLNTFTVAVNPNQVFRANYVGGEVIERFIVQVLDSSDIIVNFGGKMGPGHTRALAAFRKLYETVGRRNFSTVVGILRNSFSRPDGEFPEVEAITADFVRGYAAYLQSSPHTYRQIGSALRDGDISAAAIIQVANRQTSRWNKLEGIRRGIEGSVELGIG